MRQYFNGKFNNYRSFVSELKAKNREKITKEEFWDFIRTISGERYSMKQALDLFDYLDNGIKKYLIPDEFKEIFEH